MAIINEDQLEQLCLNWFREQGWGYAYGPDIAPDSNAPERSDYRQVVLQGRLLNALQIFNPAIPLNKLEEVAVSICTPEYPVLAKSNKAFHQQLLDGVAVSWSEGDKEKHERVRLIDFNNVANNQFLVVNQFTVLCSSNNPSRYTAGVNCAMSWENARRVGLFSPQCRSFPC
ncbi:MAG: hypothetical protein L3J24_05795 [Xanthomonadales bacterium]|nr:hypothetical protein [Xanthomonadales bacterium]